MRLACPSFTTRGSSSNTVVVLRRGSFSDCSLFGFFLLIPLQYTPSALRTQVLPHLPSALKGTAVCPPDGSYGLSRSGFFNRPLLYEAGVLEQYRLAIKKACLRKNGCLSHPAYSA